MTLHFVYDGSDLGTAAARLGRLTGFTSACEQYVVSSCDVPIDDVTGSTFSFTGLHDFHVNEDACTPARLWSGYVAAREFVREDSLVLGASHRVKLSLVDLNAILGDVVISGSDGNRPAETDIERITWLLGSAYAAGVADHGQIDSTGPVNMDATDYRGQFPRDVLTQCSELSGKNGCVIYDDASGDTTLFYRLPTQTTYASTLRLSGVAADIDNTITFGTKRGSPATLQRDPSRIYSGVYLTYANGSVYVTNATTAANYTSRDISVSPNVQIQTATVATAYANKYLADAATEDDRITCIVQLPADKVNLIREAMAIQVKFPQFPSYSAFTWVQVIRRTVAQDEETDQLYNISLELSNIKIMGVPGGPGSQQSDVTPPPPQPTPNVPTAAEQLVQLDANLYVDTTADGNYPPRGSWLVSTFGNALNTNVASGCAVGTAFWYKPEDCPHENKIVTFTDFVPPAGAIAVRTITPLRLATAVTDPEGNPGEHGGFKIAYWGGEVPQGLEGGTIIGLGDAPRSPGSVDFQADIPVSVWNQTGPNYLVYSPVVRTAHGTGCQANSEDFPYNSGLGGSYSYVLLAQPTIYWIGIPSGLRCRAGWLPSSAGSVDGENTTFTLLYWTGEGPVDAKVNGLIGEIASMDTAAKTVTLAMPPPPNAILLFDYPLAS